MQGWTGARMSSC